MNEPLAFIVGLCVGAIGGAAAVWAVARPIARAERLLARAEELLGQGNPNS